MKINFIAVPFFCLSCVVYSGHILYSKTYTSPTKKNTSSAATKVKSASKTTPKNTQSKTKGTTQSASASAKSSKKSVGKGKKSPRIRGQREIEPKRVVEIQTALANAGYFKGEPNGQWDQATIEAMKGYQLSNNFKATGKPDALSLKKLGL
jgi:peptidoglycan hydrolase-like protein with peptidoglycan-binding domain